MEVIEDIKADILRIDIDNILVANAKIKKDNHESYIKTKKDGKGIETGNSDKEELLPLLHKHIMCFKNWLSGTHHLCSEKNLQTHQ